MYAHAPGLKRRTNIVCKYCTGLGEQGGNKWWRVRENNQNKDIILMVLFEMYYILNLYDPQHAACSVYNDIRLAVSW